MGILCSHCVRFLAKLSITKKVEHEIKKIRNGQSGHVLDI